MKFTGIDFGNPGPFQVYTLAASDAASSGLVSYRIDSPTGPLLGSFAIGTTGGWNTYRQIPANASGTTGIHDVFVTFTSGAPSDFVTIDRFQFGRIGAPIPNLAATP